MKLSRPTILFLAFVLSVSIAVPTFAQTAPPRCDVNRDGKCDNADIFIVATDVAATRTAPRPTATPRPSSTATARPSSTVTRTPSPTATDVPPQVPTNMPTATSVPPSEAACGAGLNCVDTKTLVQPPKVWPDLRGKPCEAWAHDQWIVTGPNGKIYRTWHPAIQPQGMPGEGCVFDHEHGTRDPRFSKADPTLPAYGYDADLHGMAEPHAGFKTEFANRGECNELEGFCATSDVKLTVHMGTAGAGRLEVRDHTFIFDMIGDKGSIVHVRGMANTGKAATQCDPAPDTSGPDGFRLIAMPRDQALKCNIFSPYEVWQFHMVVGDNVIISKFATFDGSTVGRRQADGSLKLESTALTWPNAPFSGCKHDVYFGGFVLNENVDALDMHGVRQVIKIGSDRGRVILDTSDERKNTYKAPYECTTDAVYAVN